MSGDVRRLGEAIAAARGRLQLTQAELAGQIGVSVKTINNLEAGRTGPPRTGTAVALERALGWTSGSVRKVLLGEEPALAESVVPEAQDAGELVVLFRLPPGLSPRERERAQRLGEASVRAYLETLQDDEGT